MRVFRHFSIPVMVAILLGMAATRASQTVPETATKNQEEAPRSEPIKGTGRRGPVRVVVTDLPQLIAAHNRERRKADPTLPPLTVNPKLTAAAAAHARDQAEHGIMSHTGSDESHPADRVQRAGYAYLSCGENVAWGKWPLDRLMTGWMNSPPHRKNILGDYNEIGAARATAVDGNVYWAVEFGKSWPTLDPATAEADLLSALNAAREADGQRALVMSPTLQKVAQALAAANAQRGGFVPDDPEEENPFRKARAAGYRFAEIGLASGSGQPDPRTAVSAWLDDPAHRERLLGKTMQDAGVGYARTAEGIPFWTLLLARPQR
jgi:uncharacterized protein YkwD